MSVKAKGGNEQPNFEDISEATWAFPRRAVKIFHGSNILLLTITNKTIGTQGLPK